MTPKLHWLKTIRGQLMLGFGGILLLNLIGAVIIYGTLQHFRHRAQGTIDYTARVRELNLELKSNFLLTRRAEHNLLDNWQLKTLSPEIQNALNSQEKYLKQARQNLSTLQTLQQQNSDIEEELTILQSLFTNYESAFKNTTERIIDNDEGYQLYQQLQTLINQFVNDRTLVRNRTIERLLLKAIAQQQKHFQTGKQGSPTDLRASLEELQTALKNNPTNTPIQKLAQDYATTLDSLLLLEQQVLFNQIVAENINKEIDRILEVISQRSKIQAEQARSELIRTANYSRIALLITLITSLALTLWVSLWLGKKIVEPLTQLTKVSERIAQGSLEETLEFSTSNEFGIVATALNQMLTQLRETLTHLEQRVTERTQALQAKTESLEITLRKLRLSKANYYELINNLQAGVIIYNAEGNIMMANLAGWKLLDICSESLSLSPSLEIGATLIDESGARLPPEKRPCQQVLRTQVPLENYVMGIQRNPSIAPIWTLVNAFPSFDDQNCLTQVVVLLLDITDRKLAEEQLRYRALHDALTGLPNRTLLTERLDHAIQRVKRYPDKLFAVLFIDLDRFKVINDSLGHLVGDQLLIYIADTLKSHVRSCDTVARLGGDEFVILLEDLSSPHEVIQVIERIEEDIKKPVQVMNKTLFTSASIGIAMSSSEYATGEDILRDADNAMYRAKGNNLTSYELFNVEMRQTVQEIFELETSLRQALEEQQFILHYQPIVSTNSLQLLGFEALVRWVHPDKDLISPRKFIPLAEETGLIIPLSEWIFEEACGQMAQWCAHFPIANSLKISVNIAAYHFQSPQFLATIEQTLAKTKLLGKNLKLELTESLLIKNTDRVLSLLPQLQKQGIEISLDDFGTGYSSLNYLKRFPINTLKIDKSFVDGLDYDSNQADVSIIKAIIYIAQSLGMNVVAEGVETDFQRKQLQKLQCEAIQGYLIFPPLTSQEATNFINSQLSVISNQ
ncbi:EAL domain-containing protein [Crocosphaera chwakensis]|uniref:Putative diguanylate cyclase/phosphodiesterase (GGDEF & EAL domains) with PAS/PAC sensor(S) n=1 Tax=Crocosphaera chwakensis CCY0110 TaxID=391612 RepID=A3IW82_9CHRO|nr:EAL domain-containing protein [Crocosphaera chwakensis]EAZ89256.1 Putative diguanylate cyclase/phosphodiesterase (GGDEF & EAL domains) with PAS/PAC sensor(s) [Crocosphaera chwakensis CCY0110]